MYTVVKNETKRITRALCQEFSSMRATAGERALSPTRIARHYKSLTSGRFVPPVWATASWDGITYRVNGQHTSTMLFQLSEEDFAQYVRATGMTVTLHTLSCSDKNGLAEAYAAYDSPTSLRTGGDLNMAAAAQIPQLSQVVAPRLTLTIAAHALLTGNRRLDPAERVAVLEYLAEKIVIVDELLGTHRSDSSLVGSRKKKMNRGPVFAAMFQTISANLEQSNIFWKEVMEETGEASSITRSLAHFLNTVTVANVRSESATRGNVSATRVLHTCLHHWNAWMKGNKSVKSYRGGDDLPKVESVKK